MYDFKLNKKVIIKETKEIGIIIKISENDIITVETKDQRKSFFPNELIEYNDNQEHKNG